MRSEYLMIFVFLAIGIVGGTIYNLPRTQKQPDLSEKTPEIVFQPVAITAKDQERSDRFIKDGDDYLQVGNTVNAIEYYQAARQLTPDNPAIMFRLGIAHFIAERFPAARLFFRDSLPHWRQDDAKRIVNTLMLAKTSIAMGNSFEAIESLSTIYLSSDNVRGITSELRSEIAYELLVSKHKQAAQTYLFSIDRIDQPEFDYCEELAPNLLEIIDQHDSDIEEDSVSLEAEDGELQVLQQPNNNVNSMVVASNLNSISVSKLLTLLSEKLGVTIAIPNNVQPYITGQITRFNMESIAVSVLLDVLLHPLELTWVQNGDQIDITPIASYDRDQLAKLKAEQAIRQGRYLLLENSDHRCRESIVLANANLLLMGDDLDGASAIYQQLLDSNVTGEINAKTHYNRGLIAQKLDRSEEAVEEFLAAVDQSLNKDIRASAYYHISQSHLANNDIRPTIIAASRSLSLTDNLTIRGLAAMNLARAYLVNRDPTSANQLLFEEAEAIKHTAQDGIAGVFGAYARSLATLSPLAREKAVETLVISLADVNPTQLSSSADSLLLAKAYQQVGLKNQAIFALQVQVPNEKEVWYRQRLFESAMLQETTDPAAAVDLYKRLGSDPSDMIGQRSILRMAKQQLSSAKNPKNCIELCKTLWRHSPSDEVKAKALDLMGIAFRELGDIDSSIYCFYGMLPETSAAQNTKDQSP